VLDANKKLVGIVSDRDLLTTINIDHGKILDVMYRKVKDVMTSPVVATDPVTDIRRIAKVMLEGDVDGVPIVDEHGALVGFISRSDILQAVTTDPPVSLWR
jgi:CBS-domain-containing membrane protein